MRSRVLLIGMLAAVVLSATAFGFEAYFSDASGNKITEIWEGNTIHIAVNDPFKTACGIDAFDANVFIFDYKTGAYRLIEATFVETGFEKGVFVWDQGSIPVGARLNWDPITYRYPYRIGDRSLTDLLALNFEHVTDNRTDGTGIGGRWWNDGNWEYVDRDVDVAPNGGIGGVPTFGSGNNTGVAKRFQFVDPQYELAEIGRFENQDTLVVMVEDLLDGYWGVGQMKIKRTEATISTSLKEVYYGCADIVVTIEDRDESLRSDRPDFVPFFVIVNPGSWQLPSDTPVIVDPDDEFTLTIEVNEPLGGSTTPAVGTHTYLAGTVVSLTATPAADWSFESWTGPVANPASATTTVTMTSDITVVANFSLTPPAPTLGVQNADLVPMQSPGNIASATVNNLCALFRTGGVDPLGEPDEFGALPVLDDPIRWYNIYDIRYIQYPYDDEARVARPDGWNWAPPPDPAPVTGMLDESLIAPDGLGEIVRQPGVTRATFYAQETGSNTGVFRYNFGSLDQLQQKLGFERFPAGTTIAFYYVDPNDFSDMTLTTIHVASPYTRSKVQITDAFGNKVNQVRLGEDALYVRVQDPKQNVDDCLQEWVLVHLCDIHGEDDSEYWKLDEVSANAGIFAAAGGMRLDPVWDAVAGYQLVLDNQRFQAFNADTIFVRYNSIRYNEDQLVDIGDRNILTAHPPDILNEYYHLWDVSFDMVKVYDYQVFDGTRTTMRFLDGLFNPVTTFRQADQIYLEVTDLDQNEDSRIRERISGRWDRGLGTMPFWGGSGLFVDKLGLGDVPSKIFILNANTGKVIPVDLMETGPNTGIFKSTTGIKVSDLKGTENDLIVAFYQDPSNHHDIAVISTRVVGGDVEPPVAVSLSFDRGQYSRGDTATLTLTEPQFAGQAAIVGENVLVLKDKDGAVVKSWSEIPARAGTTNQFRVTFTIPSDIATGTITAQYTHPTDSARTAQATAQVAVAALDNVTGITITPQVLTNQVTIGIVAEPAGAVANRISVELFAVRGATPIRVPGPAPVTNASSLTWNGGNLGDGAYLAVVKVEGPGGRTWAFREWLYIRR